MSSLEVDREHVIQALCAHYANDALSTQELEAQFTIAYGATSSSELQAQLARLPALRSPRAVAVSPRIAPPADAPPADAPPATFALPEKRVLAFMTETRKTGEWVPGRRTVVRAIMGSVHMDLVECEGGAIMGEFQELHLAGNDDPTAPLVRIHGTAVMGSVKIKTRLPGESGIAAWRRRRLERGARSQ